MHNICGCALFITRRGKYTLNVFFVDVRQSIDARTTLHYNTKCPEKAYRKNKNFRQNLTVNLITCKNARNFDKYSWKNYARSSYFGPYRSSSLKTNKIYGFHSYFWKFFFQIINKDVLWLVVTCLNGRIRFSQKCPKHNFWREYIVKRLFRFSKNYRGFRWPLA